MSKDCNNNWQKYYADVKENYCYSCNQNPNVQQYLLNNDGVKENYTAPVQPYAVVNNKVIENFENSYNAYKQFSYKPEVQQKIFTPQEEQKWQGVI